MNLPPTPWVVLVTDRKRLSPDARTAIAEITALEHLIDRAIASRIDILQIRERDLDARPLLGLVARTVRRAERSATRIIVNDRADIAAAAGADGVHLPASGVPAVRLRLMSATWVVGRSVHAGDDVAAMEGLDYLLFGSVFETDSKPGLAGCGIEGLRWVAGATKLPLLAIGGITPGRAKDVIAAGAAGVAAVGLFFDEGRAPGALGVERAVVELRERMVLVQ